MLLAILIVASVSQDQTFNQLWTQVSYDDGEGTNFFYDPATTKTLKGIASVRARFVYPTKSKNWIGQHIAEFEINCKKQTFALASLATYDRSGKRTSVSNWSIRKNEPVKETIGQPFYEVACSSVRR